MNDRDWERYIRKFCDERGTNFPLAFGLEVKFVPVSKLMRHVQKKSRSD
ncbi:unnamed protein product [marine sediment metagenome]|uniref:Uncharacterized protein n=1 Tax=marine sediment metagenome TaxID=412755 RepID=X0WDE9_9ZZZZ